jgi:hypothetical protein
LGHDGGIVDGKSYRPFRRGIVIVLHRKQREIHLLLPQIFAELKICILFQKGKKTSKN